MSQSHESGLLSGIQAVRLFWSVHNQRRRSSQLTELARSLNPSSVGSSPSTTDQHSLQDEESNICEDHDSSPEEPRFCRICRMSDDQLVENVCECKGTMGQIHERCLRMWTIYKRSQQCEICRTKFRWNFERKLSDWQRVWNFCRRRYIWVLVRDLLNFFVLFGVSALQNVKLMSMVQDDQPQEEYNLWLPFLVIGASCYDLYFSRWLMNRSLKAYNLVREYWILTHDDEFLGYFEEEFAVFGEDQSEIENMLLAEYDAPD